jgi:hypothetical protein
MAPPPTLAAGWNALSAKRTHATADWDKSVRRTMNEMELISSLAQIFPLGRTA